MFCQKCGNQVGESAKVCDKCQYLMGGVASAGPMPASMTRRFVNWFLDRIFATTIFAAFILAALSTDESTQKTLGIVGPILFLGYHFICESLWQKTLAKFITKTKVVDREGKKPTTWMLLIRSLARFIPFEPFSYLFGSFPVGWHDSLSKTYVVADTMTAEEVKKMNLSEIKAQKSGRGALILIIAGVLLFVVFIIGILSSVVLASLNTARQKAAIAGMQAFLRATPPSAMLYQAEHQSYAGLCQDSEFKALLERFNAGSLNYIKACNDSPTEWAVSVGVTLGGKDTFACIDSRAAGPVSVSRNLVGETSCSDVVGGR